MGYKEIAKTSLDMQGLALAMHSYRLANKKNKTTKDFVKHGSTSIVGTSLMKANAEFLGGL